MPKLDRHTVLASLNTFAAAMVALYIAFALGLPRPYWALMTAYITSNPFSGEVRSKAVYRLAGTAIGAAATLVLVPNLADAPLLLSLALSLWVAGCLVVALHDRTPRGYMMMLAGYTAALVGFPTVVHPEAVFDVALSRAEEISLGVVCAAAMHSLVFPRPVGAVIRERLFQWLASADKWLLDLLQSEGGVENTRDRRQLAAAASDIRIMATHLPFDTSRLRDTRAAVQAMHERMLLLIPLLSSVADRRRALAGDGGLPGAAQARLQATAAWVRAGARPEPALAIAADLRASAAADARGHWRELLTESLFMRLADAVAALGACHALLDHLRAPDAPPPPDVAAAIAAAVERPLHRDLGLALRSGATCGLAMMIVCAVWIGTGWPDGAAAASMTAVFCAFYASLDDPAPAILGLGLASLQTFLLAAVYIFAIFPAIDGFPLLAAALFPPLFLFGLFIGDPKTTGRGVALAMMFGSALALQETYAADFAAFLNGNLSVYVGVFISVFVTRAMRSMTAEANVRRLLRLTWAAIARLARRSAVTEPAGFAALLVDRLALLTPRLALQEARGDAVAEDALRDLRVAMNMIAVQAARRELAGVVRARMDHVMDGLETHYARVARGGAWTAPETLLGLLDTALSAVASTTDAAGRRAVGGLVGLRRNLFPAAPPFVAQEQAA